MLELDIILNRFINTHFDSLSEHQIKAFQALLTCTDPELYQWLMGNDNPSQQDLIEIVSFIRLQNCL